LIILNDIDNVKHIVITTDNASFANANALYSFVLSKHKKVSLIITEEIDRRFSFLPWYSMRRETAPGSADLFIEAQSDSIVLFQYLKQTGILINQKMATALFAGLLEYTENFSSVTCNGTAFAVASELIGLKAQHLTCKEFLLKRESLAVFRLKALVYKNMLQSSNGEIVNVYLSDKDLICSGATQQDVEKVLKEILKMVHVKEIRLYKSKENKNIIKSIKEKEIEK